MEIVLSSAKFTPSLPQPLHGKEIFGSFSPVVMKASRAEEEEEVTELLLD